MPIIYFTKLKEDAKIPSKTSGNAGYDVYAVFDEPYKIIKPHETVMIPTGIASIIDEKHYFQLFERGSTGTKGIGQRCGVIDSSYRGEWFIPITNHNNSPLVITKAGSTDKGLQHRLEYEWDSSWPEDIIIYYPYEKALTQAVLLPVPTTMVYEISNEEFSKYGTDRGIGMLGSSGK